MGQGSLLKTISTKTVALAASPLFGVVALAGIVGWELWKAKKDEDAMKKPEQK